MSWLGKVRDSGDNFAEEQQEELKLRSALFHATVASADALFWAPRLPMTRRMQIVPEDCHFRPSVLLRR